ncbi:thiol:disulfide interchange protein [Gemmatimonas groenlandica]|uniref:Thiol:disulfide interchange protein n=1 Tax=Gemmatimonas groenlandica TaxID=2732249 RepID=A0A6M4IV64_9BACT|nr:thiol:disulfide interchange protein [Gemmatimonas groenlandica]
MSAQPSARNATPDLTPNSDLTLVSESDAFRIGATTTVALRIVMDAGWHTYWTNPGDAGLPLAAQWSLPAGVTVSALRFPTPHVLPQPPLMSFGYEREVLVLADIAVASSIPVGTPLAIAADVDFLVCADVCLPASGHVELTARTATQVQPSRWAAAIRDTRAQLVQSAAGWSVKAWRDGPRVLLFARAPASVRNTLRGAYLIPDSTGVLEHAAPQRVLISGDTLVLAMTVARGFADTTSRFTGVLLHNATSPTTSTQIDVALTPAAPPGASELIAMLEGPEATSTGGAVLTVGTATAANTSAQSLANVATADIGIWLALALAFVGGLILNLMPCVFPVLSVKILSFVERGGENDGGIAARKHAMVFTLGVLVTFWTLAGALLALRAGGAQLGWGFQLQSPAVVTVLALVVFALALNLSGVFALGMSLTRLGGVGSGERYSDSFLTGLLAVVVATPCTAPFMGAALGYALTQHAVVGLLVFTSLGLGLAAPYMVLASSPALLRKLPRPGPWLETFKQLLAFPLYATVVWLLWVLGRQAGTDQVTIVLLVSITVALAGWLAGRAQNAGKAVASSLSLALLLLTIAGGGFVIASQPVTTPTASATPAGWEPWSAARVAAARDSGHAVFVDFTAAWCLSCQVNERVALHTNTVERAFADRKVVLLRADWTSRNAEITAVLASFGRSGVPLYVMYPSKTTEPAELLPAVLTPGVVVSAVQRATTQ